MKKKTKEQFVEDARRVHGDKYDYSKVDYVNSRTKVCVICPKHGEFWQKPNSHLNGQGCKQCYNDIVGDSLRTTKEGFIEKARKIHGDKYDYSKVEYINNKTEVTIVCPIHGEFKQRPDKHIIKGNGCKLCRSDSMKRKLFGVGVFDDYNKRCDCYSHWAKMLMRCYDEKTLKKQPYYRGCSVCEEWHIYSNFKRWFDKNHVEGWHLDKDILIKGNKVYSPQTCCFVPPQINSLIVNRKSCRGKYVIGVYKGKYGRFSASCSVDEKSVRIGMFDTELEAFNAYKEFKEENIKRVADEWRDKIEPCVYEALCNYKVEIDD